MRKPLRLVRKSVDRYILPGQPNLKHQLSGGTGYPSTDPVQSAGLEKVQKIDVSPTVHKKLCQSAQKCLIHSFKRSKVSNAPRSRDVYFQAQKPTLQTPVGSTLWTSSALRLELKKLRQEGCASSTPKTSPSSIRLQKTIDDTLRDSSRSLERPGPPPTQTPGTGGLYTCII